MRLGRKVLRSSATGGALLKSCSGWYLPRPLLEPQHSTEHLWGAAISYRTLSRLWYGHGVGDWSVVVVVRCSSH